MSGKKLAVNTTVGGVTYEAGTVPPAEVAEQITNPACWGDEPEPEGDEPKQPAKKAAPRKSS